MPKEYLFPQMSSHFALGEIAGPHGSSQYPVADGGVLREGAENCPRRSS